MKVRIDDSREVASLDSKYEVANDLATYTPKQLIDKNMECAGRDGWICSRTELIAAYQSLCEGWLSCSATTPIMRRLFRRYVNWASKELSAA